MDAFIQHELSLDEDSYEVEIDLSACLKELSFPYRPQEPELPQEDLQKLDALAEQVDVQRLVGLDNPKELAASVGQLMGHRGITLVQHPLRQSLLQGGWMRLR